ncbi:TetR/AcrR family transcriptional regulator [Kitasatospora sp. NPDC015120]|uniref:TetR/AcrR family transcriptional regulator n=1 Tax=Kitasatospora sp. NPDC015120 TaxID=3364023 RepID=UPI0036F47FBE
MEKRKRSRRGTGQQLRGEILDAVDRLLERAGGYDGLTMRGVATEAGVTAGAIYLHFDDKASLFWASLARHFDALAARMQAAEAQAGEDARDRLEALAHAYCRFGLANHGPYRLMFEVQQPTAGAPDPRVHPAAQVTDLFARAVDRCGQEGRPLRLPVLQTAQTLWMALHGIVAVQHVLPFRPVDEAVDGGAGEAAPAGAAEPGPFVDYILQLTDGALAVLVGTERGEGPARVADTAVERELRARLAPRPEGGAAR